MTTSLTEKIHSARDAGLKVAAAYAVTQKAVATTKTVANALCHTWRIENEYAYETWEAAVKLAAEHQARLPGLRQHSKTGDSHNRAPKFRATDWTWTPVPGVSRAIQARMTSPGAIEFRAPRLKDLAALGERIELLREEIDEDEGDIFVATEVRTSTDIYAWGKAEWEWRMNKMSRTFDSVVLPKATQEEIEAELTRFSESRDRLRRLEMPWRRGFLLSGPPGTGKTSLSLAIAGALRFSLATLSLTDITSDGALKKAVSSLPAHTVLVIEDIDAYSVSNERDHNAAQDGALSLSGLLNSLDGFETPDGLVTILTTNHIEKLDPALIRSGRMDRTFNLGYIEATELERLFTWFYEAKAPTPAPEITGAVNLCPAEAAEVFKQHLDDPAAGWEAVCNHINNTEITHKNLEVVA